MINVRWSHFIGETTERRSGYAPAEAGSAHKGTVRAMRARNSQRLLAHGLRLGRSAVMRRFGARAVVSAAAFAVIGAFGSATAPAVAAIPAIHIEVPHIEVPTLRVGRALEDSEWVAGNPEYEARLRAAGSEESLALEEILRETQEEQVRKAFKNCGEHAARAALDGEVQAVANDQSLTFHDAIAAVIKGCLIANFLRSCPSSRSMTWRIISPTSWYPQLTRPRRLRRRSM